MSRVEYLYGENWGGWYVTTPCGQVLGPYCTESQARNAASAIDSPTRDEDAIAPYIIHQPSESRAVS
jgi:hypothetical protein